MSGYFENDILVKASISRSASRESASELDMEKEGMGGMLALRFSESKSFVGPFRGKKASKNPFPEDAGKGLKKRSLLCFPPALLRKPDKAVVLLVGFLEEGVVGVLNCSEVTVRRIGQHSLCLLLRVFRLRFLPGNEGVFPY